MVHKRKMSYGFFGCIKFTELVRRSMAKSSKKYIYFPFQDHKQGQCSIINTLLSLHYQKCMRTSNTSFAQDYLYLLYRQIPAVSSFVLSSSSSSTQTQQDIFNLLVLLRIRIKKVQILTHLYLNKDQLFIPANIINCFTSIHSIKGFVVYISFRF